MRRSTFLLTFLSLFAISSFAFAAPDSNQAVDPRQAFKPGDTVYDSQSREIGSVLDVMQNPQGDNLVRIQVADFSGLKQREILMPAAMLKPAHGGGYETLLTDEELADLPETKAGGVP